MTEDLDNDLEGLADDLDNLDFGGEGEDAPEAADAEGASESVELDDDLAAMLDDAGGDEGAGDAAAAEGGEGEDAGGLDLGGLDLGGGEGGGEGGGGAVAAPAPAQPSGVAALAASLSGDQASNLEFLLDIKLHVTFEVGRSKMVVSDLLTLGQGSVIELHRLVGDELDFLINGKLIAKGEVVVVNEKFGCKITEIVSPEDRIKHLGAVG